MSNNLCKSRKCECTLITTHDEFNEKKLLLSFCTERINIGWKQFICVFIAIYLVWSAYEISLLKLQINTILQNNCMRTKSDGEIPLHVHSEIRSELTPFMKTSIESTYSHIERSKRSTNSTARGRRKNKHKKRRRRKRCHCKPGKDGAMGPRGPKGPQGIPGIEGASFALRAAHYKAEIHNPLFKSFDDGNGCEAKWNGVLCKRNATFMNNNRKWEVIRFFNTNELNDTEKSPFSPVHDGRFKILQDGLMLFYLNIALWANGPFRDSFAVLVDNKRIMQCIESKDVTMRSDFAPLFNAKEKTCSATGLQYVRKEQIVSVKMQSDTAITLHPELTYFGAVLLR